MEIYLCRVDNLSYLLLDNNVNANNENIDINLQFYFPLQNKLIDNSEILNINSDQRFHGAPYIDFMGTPAKTSTGLAQLARKFNLPVLLGHVERTHGAHHEIVFDEFINIPHTDDANADEINGMKLVNDAMGRIILKKPDEYLWLHKRWS